MKKEDIMLTVLVLAMFFSTFCAYLTGLKNGREGYRQQSQVDDDGISTDGVIKAVLGDGTLTFTGDGTIVDSSRWLNLTDEQRRQVKRIVIGNGITYIDSLEFSGYAGLSRPFINLEEVVIDTPLKYIGHDAFNDNNALSKVYFNEACERFDDGALKGLSPDMVIGIDAPSSAYGITKPIPTPARSSSIMESYGGDYSENPPVVDDVF